MSKKEKKEIIKLIEGYIEYRGGMGNRIDAFDILDLLRGKRKHIEKWIKRNVK